jgi:hypothetical protein
LLYTSSFFVIQQVHILYHGGGGASASVQDINEDCGEINGEGDGAGAAGGDGSRVSRAEKAMRDEKAVKARRIELMTRLDHTLRLQRTDIKFDTFFNLNIIVIQIVISWVVIALSRANVTLGEH